MWHETSQYRSKSTWEHQVSTQTRPSLLHALASHSHPNVASRGVTRAELRCLNESSYNKPNGLLQQTHFHISSEPATWALSGPALDDLGHMAIRGMGCRAENVLLPSQILVVRRPFETVEMLVGSATAMWRRGIARIYIISVERERGTRSITRSVTRREQGMVIYQLPERFTGCIPYCMSSLHFHPAPHVVLASRHFSAG